MKKLFILLILAITFNNVVGQEMGHVDKIFDVVKDTTQNIKTDFTYKIDDVFHPIYITKDGVCYIYKARKNGNIYKKYLRTKTNKLVSREYNIEYKGRRKKQNH